MPRTRRALGVMAAFVLVTTVLLSGCGREKGTVIQDDGDECVVFAKGSTLFGPATGTGMCRIKMGRTPSCVAFVKGVFSYAFDCKEYPVEKQEFLDELRDRGVEVELKDLSDE